MENEQDKIAETVDDIQNLRSKLSDRHADNINLSLRLDSALKAVVGSLGATTGGATFSILYTKKRHSHPPL